MKYITAEGPSCDLCTWLHTERPTGHTYPAAREPVRFEPYDPEITARAQNAVAEYAKDLQLQDTQPVRYMAMPQIEAVQELQDKLETAQDLLNSAQRVLELYAKTGSASPLPARSVLAAIRAMKAQESK